MIDYKKIKLESQAAINRTMKRFRDGLYEEPPTKVVCFDRYDRLSRLQCDQGVVALVLACNLSGGSLGDMDLYKLVRTYLWNAKARSAINDVVKHHGL